MKNKGLEKQNLTIGQIAARTGLATSAIRFHEDQGLVSPGRNAAGQRRFARSDIRRLSFVMIAQTMGFSINEIREALASLPDHRTPTKGDWAKISARFGAELDRRIATMQALRTRLDGCLGCGCLSLSNCHLFNADDRISAMGPGPRYVMGDTPD